MSKCEGSARSDSQILLCLRETVSRWREQPWNKWLSNTRASNNVDAVYKQTGKRELSLLASDELGSCEILRCFTALLHSRFTAVGAARRDHVSSLTLMNRHHHICSSKIMSWKSRSQFPSISLIIHHIIHCSSLAIRNSHLTACIWSIHQLSWTNKNLCSNAFQWIWYRTLYWSLVHTCTLCDVTCHAIEQLQAYVILYASNGAISCSYYKRKNSLTKRQVLINCWTRAQYLWRHRYNDRWRELTFQMSTASYAVDDKLKNRHVSHPFPPVLGSGHCNVEVLSLWTERLKGQILPWSGHLT